MRGVVLGMSRGVGLGVDKSIFPLGYPQLIRGGVGLRHKKGVGLGMARKPVDYLRLVLLLYRAL